MGFPTINKIQLLAYPHLRNPPYSCKLVNGSLITELIYPILVKSNAISLNTSPGGSKPKAHPRCYDLKPMCVYINKYIYIYIYRVIAKNIEMFFCFWNVLFYLSGGCCTCMYIYTYINHVLSTCQLGCASKSSCGKD